MGLGLVLGLRVLATPLLLIFQTLDSQAHITHEIQDLIDNKVISLPTRPSITNNPLPNHNFGRGPRINCLMTEEESEEDPSELIYDLPECFYDDMGRINGYDICCRA